MDSTWSASYLLLSEQIIIIAIARTGIASKSATARGFFLYCLQAFFRLEHAASVSQACKVIGSNLPEASARPHAAQVLFMNYLGCFSLSKVRQDMCVYKQTSCLSPPFFFTACDLRVLEQMFPSPSMSLTIFLAHVAVLDFCKQF
jgi:hypothetical protein